MSAPPEIRPGKGNVRPALGSTQQSASLAQLGSLVGPYAVGWIRTSTGSFDNALYLMAACSAASAGIAVAIRPGRQGDHAS